MDFSEEWKSLWPISSVFSPPLLLSDRAAAGKTSGRDSGSSPPKSREIGPLFFHPSPHTLTLIFTSPSLYTPTPSPFSSLSLSRFLQTTTNSILPSSSSSIASRFGPQISHTQLPYNSLQLLRCHGSSSVFVFFPTGKNSDQVGFILLTVKDGKFGVKVSSATNVLKHRILKLLVNRVTDSYYSVDSCFCTIGYLMICTMYSVYWYSAQVKGLGSDSETPKLVFLGSKVFRSSVVVDASWSPHLEKECVVLLESGELFLFDMDSYYSTRGSSSINFKGKNLRALWDDDVPEEGSWLGCEFSWHPRILVVIHSGIAFLVDLRSERCKVNCLLRIGMLAVGKSVQNDRFVAFSRAGSDGFHFTVASNNLLILCDVRKPMMPVLQWVHGIDNPTYVGVIKLSELRSNSKNDEYKWASETGYCILLGSFWNCEFSLFCYGPNTRTSVASEISKFCKSLYAWELPSELSLSARDCYCGSCLVREEYSKDALPKWIVWQQKKEIVLGFCILDKDLSVELFEPEIFGGFTVIRLMSSGKLELQKYLASPQPMNFSDKAHHESSLLYNKSLIYTNGDEKYKFPRKYQYLKLDYLYGHLNDNLEKVLNKKKIKAPDKTPEVSSNSDFHKNVCKKLMECGIAKFRSSPAISYAIRDIVSPMSVLEIAVMSIWSSLPAVLLRMGFVTYAELFSILANKKNLPLEFLDVPDQPHLPPFSSRNPSHRSNKWSHNMQHSNAHVGPAAPLPFLVTYSKLYIEEEADELSANEQLELQCSEVIEMVNKVVPDANDSEPVVSLANDKDDMHDVFQDPDQYSLYKPLAFSNKNCNADPTSGSSSQENLNYSTFVHRNSQKEVFSNDKLGFLKPEIIGAICPTGLKFNNRAINYLPTEFKYFIGQQKKFQESFNANRSSFRKRDL